MNKFVKFGLPVIIIAGIGGLAYVNQQKKNSKPVEVRIEATEKRDLVATVVASGQIQPRTKVNVSADVTGKIIRLAVKEGDIVQRGQFLLQIDPEQPTAALQRAEAQLATAKAQAAQSRANMLQAKSNYERQIALQKTSPLGVTAEQLEQLKTQVEVGETQLDAANSSVDQSSAGVRDAKQALSRTTITAPMSGKVTRLVVQEGEVAIQGTLNKDAATLLTISDMSVLETKVKVDETEVARISVGDSAVIQIDAFPDTNFVGRVVEISNSSTKGASTTTTTDQAVDYEVKVQLINPPKETRPDFSATARIVTDAVMQKLSIPIIALTLRENEKLQNGDTAQAISKNGAPQKQLAKRDVEGVFVVGADNKVTFVPVKVGITGERHFEVISGLKLGDRIVAGTYDAIRELKDGTLVKETKPEVKKPTPGKKS
ncbi:MAG: efflux RND transporter periplasmic adaptor subunit [Gemmatimonadaceae bacterium]